MIIWSLHIEELSSFIGTALEKTSLHKAGTIAGCGTYIQDL